MPRLPVGHFLIGFLRSIWLPSLLKEEGREENICCHLPDTAITEKAGTEFTDEESSFDVFGSENIEVHEIPYEGFIFMAIE